MHKTLDEMLAEAAIRDLQIRYCRAVDRMDWDLFRSCFHEDALFDYALFTGGLEPFIAQGIAALAGYEATQHFTGNQLVEVRGDAAWAEHYAVATHRIAATADVPEHDLVTAIRYVDRAECRGGDWRIARRELILDGWRIDYDPEAGPAQGLARKRSARRDRSDRSYFGLD
jgi:3-phenylpropionate/cinnamic acid dioxygenase small subunit